MRKFTRRFRDLSEKAQQLKHVVEAAPQQAAELRASVLLAAGQLQQLRGEVQASFAGVYVDSEERLQQVMREINESETVFAEVGYELAGVELEFSPIQRVIIRLEKVADVSLARIRSLISGVQSLRTTQALLSSILKAEEVAGRVSLDRLEYAGLVVHVGAAPSIRVCWSAPGESEPPPTAPPSTVAQSSAVGIPAYGDTGFFAPRAVPPASPPASVTVPASPPVVAAAPASATPAIPGTESQPGAWGRSALEKFKTTPGYSKYRSLLRK